MRVHDSSEESLIGNPTSWYDGTTFTWSNGRRLASAVNSSTGLNNSYTYDMDGLRLTKTVGSVEHRYVWQGSKLVAEYFGGTEFEFFYDENGAPYAFSYKATASAAPVMYYYVTNLQGDVVSILNASGTSVAEYSYNAWGKVLSATGTMAAINPIRYRGYYFDSDSGLYYLKSRYYDPNLQRFINSDGQLTTGDFIGANVFAYCGNNPANNVDPDGNFFFGAVIGGIIGGISGAISAVKNGKSVKAGAITGAVTGLAVGFLCDVAATGGLSAFCAVALCGIAASAGNVANQFWNYKIEKKQQSSATTKSGLGTSRSTSSGTTSNSNSITEDYNEFFEDYLDAGSAITSGVTAMIFAPASIGAGKLVNSAFNGVASGGTRFVSEFIANAVAGGGVSILQSIIDFFDVKGKK